MQDTPKIKPSADYEDFETGAKRGRNEVAKGRYDLVPWEAVHQLAIHCAEGAMTYGERNCEKGIPVSSLLDSAMRHLAQYAKGDDDEPHLRAALWNISYIFYMEANKPEMCNLPTRKEYAAMIDKKCEDSKE